MALYARWCDERRYPLIAAPDAQLAEFVVEQLGRFARATAMNRLIACRGYYRFLQATGVRADDPTSELPIRRDRLLPRAPFSSVELRELLGACQNDRHRALLLFLVGSGCRRDEAARLRIEDIDWRRRRVKVRGKGAKERWVAPGATALEAIQAYIGERREGIVFQMSGHAVYQMVRRIGRRAGVVGAHPHRTRVTFAVNFLRRWGNLVALKQVLGHTNIKTTEVYASFGIEEGALSMQRELDLGGDLEGHSDALVAQRSYSLADRVAG